MTSSVAQLVTMHARLDKVLAQHGSNVEQALRIGLPPAAAASLHLVRRALDALVLGFDENCAGRALPRYLRSPIDGTTVPVRAMRCAHRGQAHAPPEVVNTTANGGAGTLGAILRSRRNPAQLFALTAGHVVAANRNAAGGDAIEFFDRGTMLFTGSLSDWIPNFIGGEETDTDAAIASVEAQALENFAARSGEWPRGWNPSVQDGEPLMLRARDGRIVSGTASLPVSCHMGLEDTGVDYLLTSVRSWDALDGTRRGDSGGPVWNAGEQLVGIHAGSEPGNPQRPLFIPISRIVEYFKADVVSRGEALTKALPPRPRNVFDGRLPASIVSVEVDVMARTMWGEARGEGEQGMHAVACVILNRVVRQSYWGKTIAAVCRKPYQFSCWNLDDPNLRQMLTIDGSDLRFGQAMRIATALLSDARGLARRQDDPTNGATHYHTASLQPPPRWARMHAACARIGRHVFYNDIS